MTVAQARLIGGSNGGLQLTDTTGTQQLALTADSGKLKFSAENNTTLVKLAGVKAPEAGDSADHVASKGYVDSVAQGLDVKESCRFAYLAGDGSMNIADQLKENVAFKTGETFDDGDRILVAGQTDKSENGIYKVVGTSGGVRVDDMADGVDAQGFFTFIEQGTYQGLGFVVVPHGTDGNGDPKETATVGTDDLNITQFSGAGAIVAGAGLSKSGSTIKVDENATQVMAKSNPQPS